MKILVLASAIPPGSTMPGSPRLYSLCKHLSGNHSLTLLTFKEEDEGAEAAKKEAAAGIFEDIIVLPRAPEPRWWGRQHHRLVQAPSFSTRYRNRTYHDSVREKLRRVLSAGRFDVLYVDGIECSQYVRSNPISCPAAIDLHDCLSLLATRSLGFEHRKVERLRLQIARDKLARWEASLSQSFGRVIVNSEVDEEELKRLDPTASTLTISNGVDIEYFQRGAVVPDSQTLVFTGVMGYGPNEDAAVYFSDEIFPLIQAQNAEATFEIVGKGPGDRVKALGSRPGIRVVGEVPDIRPYIASSSVFVCPLRWGTGVKNKVLASLAMGTPVVATPISLDGLDLRPEVDVLVADDPSDFAAKVSRLLQNSIAREKMSRDGRESVERLYSWRNSGEMLERTLDQLASRNSSRRSALSVEVPV